MKEVARVAGVSAMTVSRVLSGKCDGKVSAEVAERIRRTARELGYCQDRLAQAMRTGISPLIAFCFHDTEDRINVPNLYWFELISDAKQAFADERFEALFITFSSAEDLAQRVTSLKNANMIGGIISNLIPGRSAEICRVLKDSGLPCAVFGDPGAAETIPAAVLDNSGLISEMLKVLSRRCGARELRWFPVNGELPGAEEAADGGIFYQVDNELSRTILTRRAGIPRERIVILSRYQSELGGHGGFVVKSHVEERCRYALSAIRRQMRGETVTELRHTVRLGGDDLLWIDPI